jgi:hypothetical protein
MKSKILILMMLSASLVFAQELYMPPAISKAYQNGTRLKDGSVSQNYRQNKSRYSINAIVEPSSRQIDAKAKIIYYHNFPDTLVSFGFHAYKDVYDAGMSIKKLVVNGERLNVTDTRRVRKTATHYGVYIGNDPLTQGDSLLIEMEWSIQIPEKVGRDGAYDESSMFVAYWYPEIAVYDDVFGWDKIDHDGNSEFYHDFSDFDVTIEIPDDYLIWASAAPINEKEVYPDFILERLNETVKSKEPVTIVSKKDYKGLALKSNVWKYKVTDFPDFSFAFSNRFIWESQHYQDEFGTFILHSVFPAENTEFKNILKYQIDALKFFHDEFPKRCFPFKNFVAFNGGKSGGMEFAGMCNNEAITKDYNLGSVNYSAEDLNRFLTIHEMMHMYFPFQVGINEKRFAWMDEGMAEFSEIAFSGLEYPNVDLTDFMVGFSPPLITETHSIPNFATANSYLFASQAYFELYILLGEETFNRCMKVYMDRWQNKHPIPYDFFFTFNEVSGQDLNWFWNSWFFNWGYVDISMEEFTEGKVKLVNKGGKPVSFNLIAHYNGGVEQTHLIKGSVWEKNNTFLYSLEYQKDLIKLECKVINNADLFQENNVLMNFGK